MKHPKRQMKTSLKNGGSSTLLYLTFRIIRAVQKWPDPKIRFEIESKPIWNCVSFLGLSNRY